MAGNGRLRGFSRQGDATVRRQLPVDRRWPEQRARAMGFGKPPRRQRPEVSDVRSPNDGALLAEPQGGDFVSNGIANAHSVLDRSRERSGNRSDAQGHHKGAFPADSVAISETRMRASKAEMAQGTLRLVEDVVAPNPVMSEPKFATTQTRVSRSPPACWMLIRWRQILCAVDSASFRAEVRIRIASPAAGSRWAQKRLSRLKMPLVCL